MADSQQKTVLFNKLVEGKLSTGELDELIEWLGNDQLDPEARLLILEELTQSIPTEQVSLRLQADLNAKLPVILSAPKFSKSTYYFITFYLVALCCGYYLINERKYSILYF